MASTHTFQCPNCGSPLTANGSDKEIQCSYCGSTVIVPEELRAAPPPPVTTFEFRPAPSVVPQESSTVSTSAGCATKLGLVIGLAAAAIGIVVAVAVFFIPSRVISPVVQQTSPAQSAGQSTAAAAVSLAQNAIQTANALVKTSVPPTPAPTEPVPTPVPFTKTLFQDTFSSASSGWPRARNSKYTLEYKGGNYHVLINEQNVGQEVTRNGEGSYADASIEVDVQQTAGPSDGLIGVTCRNDNNGDFYSFEFSQDGAYGIYKYSNDNGNSLDEQTLEPGLIQQNGVNHLEGVCAGDTLTLLLNGQVLSQVQDSSYTEGQAGLLVRTGSSGASGADVLFSHLLVKGP
jgi:DNA-directed RNA polymerase subunit RPC12/RpoP